MKGDAGADVEWILKAGGVVSRGTPNFFAQNERSARSAERFDIFSGSPADSPTPFCRGEKRGGSGDDAWLFGPESAGAGSNSELNSRKKLPGIRKSDFSQRRRASSVGATPGDTRGHGLNCARPEYSSSFSIWL